MSDDRKTVRALLRSRLKSADCGTDTDDLKMLFDNLSITRDDLISLMAKLSRDAQDRSELDKAALQRAFWENRLSLNHDDKAATGKPTAVAMQYILDSEKFLATSSWEELLRELGNDFYFMNRPRYETDTRGIRREILSGYFNFSNESFSMKSRSGCRWKLAFPPLSFVDN